MSKFYAFLEQLSKKIIPSQAAFGEDASMSSSKNSAEALDYARTNSRLATIIAVGSTLITLGSLVASGYITRLRNHVAAIPVNEVFEYPMVHWMNRTIGYEEDAKPISVALRYVAGMYEVNPLDFTQVNTDSSTGKVSSNNKTSDLLAYVVPGTMLFNKVAESIEKSNSQYQAYYESKAIKVFLISDISTSLATNGLLRVSVIGQTVIHGQDGTASIPAEELGIKHIILYMTKDIDLYSTGGSVAGGNDALNAEAKTKPVNPEGWYIIREAHTTLKKEELDILRDIRSYTDLKSTL